MKANSNYNNRIIIVGGGVGPMAGVDLHRLIIQNTKTDGRDQDHLRVLHISFSDIIEDRSESLANGTFYLPARNMAHIVEQALLYCDAFKCKGVVGIPCNTFHAKPIFDEFSHQLEPFKESLDIVHMIDETIGTISKSVPKGNRIGVISTSGTKNSRLYDKALEIAGYIPLYADNQELIHQAIYHETWGIKATSTKTAENQAILYSAIEKLYQEHVQAIILACTEIPLVVQEQSFKGIPLINPVDILSKALIEKATI